MGEDWELRASGRSEGELRALADNLIHPRGKLVGVCEERGQDVAVNLIHHTRQARGGLRKSVGKM